MLAVIYCFSVTNYFLTMLCMRKKKKALTGCLNSSISISRKTKVKYIQYEMRKCKPLCCTYAQFAWDVIFSVLMCLC